MCCSIAAPKSQLANRQAVNFWSAIAVPLMIAGILGYATWVVVVLISVHYLLYPSDGPPRSGAAAAILALHYLFFLLMILPYCRTVYLAATGAGHIPQGPITSDLRATFIEDPATAHIQLPCFKPPQAADPEKALPRPGYTMYTLDVDGIFKGTVALPPGSESFYAHDVFQCDPVGLPVWCSTCRTWKPDRAHHCSDDGRCARKLDHFCPWAGGAVSEANFKFFVQFVIWGTFYNTFIFITFVYFTAESRRRTGHAPAAWEVAIGLAVFAMMFASGMAVKSVQNMLLGLTTVDAIDAPNRSVCLAVRIPEDYHLLPSRKESAEPIQWLGTVAYPFYTLEVPESQREERRTFAIIRTPKGVNPWDLGKMGNWRSVMGERWWDWFLPIRRSPCEADHGQRSMYALGPGMKDVLARAGIPDA